MNIYFCQVFPAPAGVILPLSSAPFTPLSFPRTCGGDPTPYNRFAGSVAFSPHLRG